MPVEAIILGLEEMRATLAYYAGFGESAAAEVLEAAIQALQAELLVTGNFIERLKALEDLAVTVQCNAYFAAPPEKGCPRGHMGHSGLPGCGTRSDRERAHDYITSISLLLQETVKDQNAQQKNRRG